MFFQPLNRTIHRWKPQGPGARRLYAVRVGGPAIVTANLIMPGVPTRDVVVRCRELAPHAAPVAVDQFLVTVSTVATRKDDGH
jgi:hypothetical protein